MSHTSKCSVTFRPGLKMKVYLFAALNRRTFNAAINVLLESALREKAPTARTVEAGKLNPTEE